MIIKNLPAILFVLLLSACTTAPTLPTTSTPLSQLDKKSLAGWSAASSATIELDNNSQAPSPTLKITLSPGAFPGFIYDTPDLDLSHVDAIRFRLVNPGPAFKLAFRVDDANSKDFATRFQSDMPLNVASDANPTNKPRDEYEISTACLRQGNLFSRGIDVAHIRSLRFFATGLKEKTTLYLSNIHLVSKSGSVLTTDLMDLANPVRIPPEAKDATTLTPEIAKAGVLNPAPPARLKIEIASGSKYPGVTFYHFPHDFLGCHFLALHLSPVGNASMPDNVNIKLTDALGRKMTFSTSLAENHGSVMLPLELAGQLELGNIRELTLFFANADNKSLYLDYLWLERFDTVDFPTVHTDSVPGPAVTLDFKPLQALGKNSVFMAMLFVPLADGQTRIIRCNSETKGITLYQLPAAALGNAAPGKPIQVWAYLIEHGVWNFRQTTIPSQPLPQTLTFDDPKKFNH